MHQLWEACPPPLAGRRVSKDAECIQKTRKKGKRGVEVYVLIKIMRMGGGGGRERALQRQMRQ